MMLQSGVQIAKELEHSFFPGGLRLCCKAFLLGGCPPSSSACWTWKSHLRLTEQADAG